MKKKTDEHLLLCWHCTYSKPNDDPNYRTPEGGPIFYNCYADPEHVQRGIMDNVRACSRFKERI